MADAASDGDVPAEIVNLTFALPKLAEALLGEDPGRVVAIGSSSTAGRGDAVPYHHRLEMCQSSVIS